MRELRGLGWIALTGCLLLTGCGGTNSDVLVPTAGTPSLASVSGVVWHDLNGDGQRDEDLEPGLQGVAIALFNSSGAQQDSSTTDPSGTYRFLGLAPGTYSLGADPSPLGTATLPSACGQTGDCSSITFVLEDEQLELVLDVGFRLCQAVLGGRVWLDLDCDGLQGPAEPGLAGVRVELLHEGREIGESISDRDGAYAFGELCSSNEDYRVRVDPRTLPRESFATLCEVGDDDALDSECSPASRSIVSDTQIDLQLDFGYCLTCSGALGDLVWLDADCDGLQDPDEPGLAGFEVFLSDPGGALLDQTVTADDGRYEFQGLCAGSYVVEVDLGGSQLLRTACEVAADPELDSNCNPALVTFADDDGLDASIDFGFCPQRDSRIGDRVWFDINCDGFQDPDEPGMSGISVFLRSAQGELLDSTLSDEGGHYEFSDLLAGHYQVEVDLLPDQLRLSPCEQFPDDEFDSNCNPSVVILDHDSSVDLSIDFGICIRIAALGSAGPPSYAPYAPGSGAARIAGQVLDERDLGLDRSRLVVIACEPGGARVARAVVDRDGHYQLPALPAGALELTLEVAPGTPARRAYADQLPARSVCIELGHAEQLELSWSLGPVTAGATRAQR